MMDRNLGATSAAPGEIGTIGLMYQWGRKDPFMGASTFTSNTPALSTGTWSAVSDGSVALAEVNPMTFYKNTELPNGSWASEKTGYDPCPTGWRVPVGGENDLWAKAMMKTESFKDSSLTVEKGLNFANAMGESDTIYYPLSGELNRVNGLLTEVGSIGGCWSCSHRLDYSFLAFSFGFKIDGNVYLRSGAYRSYGRPVRCQKE